MITANRHNELMDEINELAKHKEDFELRINSNNLSIEEMESDILKKKKEQKNLAKA